MSENNGSNLREDSQGRGRPLVPRACTWQTDIQPLQQRNRSVHPLSRLPRRTHIRVIKPLSVQDLVLDSESGRRHASAYGTPGHGEKDLPGRDEARVAGERDRGG